MTAWLGVLLIGFGVTDLVHAVRPRRVLPETVGAIVAILLGLLAGYTHPGEVVGLVLVAVGVLAWGQAVTRGFGAGPAWPALVVFAGSCVAVLAVSPLLDPADGLLGRWLRVSDLPGHLSVDRALLLAGLFAVQLSTGNVLVRLMLAVTGTVNPARPPDDDPELRLKGGRLLGPMERVFILGLGLAGDITAAAIVVAAKGLLRFPELNSRREQEQIHRLTEYFLVGSFASWLIALAALAIAG